LLELGEAYAVTRYRPKAEHLTALGRALDIKRKLSLWQVEVHKEPRELVAICRGSAYHAKDKSYDETPSVRT